MSRTFACIVAVCLSAGCALSAAAGSAQSAYAPPGLCDVEQVRLQNGFQVLLKQRAQSHNVSFRLIVGLGERHFDCKHRETAHIIEHLLFSGTSRHNEAELERLIQESGGSWNAATGARSTVYQVDIFDRYASVAVDTLHEILTDTEFTPDKVGKVKDIVIREDGGKPSALRRLLYRYDVGKSAWTKANERLLPGEGAICSDLMDVDAISGAGLADTFKAAYVPGNITLVVVGNFDRTALLTRIRRTFGTMAAAPRMPLEVSTPPFPDNGPILVNGTMAPLLGSSGYVGMAFRTEGRDSDDAPALTVLSAYLNEALYELVRVQNGLSYGPEVSAFFRPDYGILYLTADTGIRNRDRVRGLMRQSLARITARPVTAEDTERTKRKILLQWVQGYETNSGTANFYTENLSDLDRFGKFRDHAAEIEAVTADDVNRVAAVYLQTDRCVEILGMPTMTYTQLCLASGAVLLLTVMAVIYTVLKRVRRRAELRDTVNRPGYSGERISPGEK